MGAFFEFVFDPPMVAAPVFVFREVDPATGVFEVFVRLLPVVGFATEDLGGTFFPPIVADPVFEFLEVVPVFGLLQEDLEDLLDEKEDLEEDREEDRDPFAKV